MHYRRSRPARQAGRGSFPPTMPAQVIGRRNQYQSGSSLRGTLLVILAIVLVAGFVVLAFVDVAPPQRTREIPIPPEKFSK